MLVQRPWKAKTTTVATLSSWRGCVVCVVVQDNKIVNRFTPSESFDAVHSGKDTVSASLRFKQPGWLGKDMHDQASKNIIERTASEEKDTEAESMNGI